MSTSLNRLLPWDQILPLLGTKIRENVLPAVVQCPLCQGKRGYVYHDLVLGGQWFFCHDCHAAVDMIELAAAVWKTDVLATLRRAREMGANIPEAAITETAVECYTRQCLEPRKQARKFWKDAQDYFVSSIRPSLRLLQSFLGVQDHLTPTWQYHGAAFIGAADVQATRELFHQNARQEPHVRSGAVLFKGKGWEDVIVIPFWDLPGRICGFLFIGREGRAEDMLFRRAPEFRDFGRDRQHPAEAGVTMPMAALSQPKRHDLFGNTMFVMDDPILAVRFQIRYMRNTEIPLALIGSYEDSAHRVKNVWSWLPTEDVIFWSPRQSTTMLRQAREANARISTVAVPEATDNERLRWYPPEEWFHRAKAKTVSWQIAVQQRLEQATPDQAEELLAELELIGSELRKFITTCKPPLAKRLQAIHDGKTQIRKVSYGQKFICEDANGWAIETHTTDARRERRFSICDVIVRIEHILRTSTDRSYYQGVVIFKGHIIPFTEKVETLDKGTWAWLKSVIAVNGLGAPTGMSAWTSKIMDIALRFCQPDVIYGADVVGWDDTRQQFNFPKFAIRIPGEVIDDHVCLFTDPHVPGQGLIRPESIGQRGIQALSEHNEETQIFWAVTACVANNVLAPALHFVPRGILLEGVGAHTIGAAAAVHLGCNEFSVASTSAVQNIMQEHGSHHWPTLFQFTKEPTWNTLDAWLSTGVKHRVIFKAAAPTANVLGVRQQWNIITCHRKLGSMQLVRDVAPRILPAYVQDLCSRRLEIPQRHGDETDNILDDMANWFHRHGGDPAAVLRARDILRVPGRPEADVFFMELLRHLHREGHLAKIRLNFDDVGGGLPKIIDDKDANQIWVPQRSVIDLVEATASLPLDLLPATKALERHGCLHGERERDGKLGWVIDADWFNKRWLELEAQHVE